jgi:hypothetical protein
MNTAELAAKLFDHPTSNTPPAPMAGPDTLLTSGATGSPVKPPAASGDAWAELRQPKPTDQQIAEKLYPQEKALPNANETTPANIREMREADNERKIFSPQQQLADAIPDGVFADVTAEGITDEHKTAAVAEFREIAADVGMGGQEVKSFVGLYRENLATPPSDEQVANWHEASVKRIQEKYGQRADAVMGLAQKLVERDPRVGQIIKNGRLGNHPAVVEMVVEAALRESTRGRL